jgi:hypothetical protein
MQINIKPQNDDDDDDDGRKERKKEKYVNIHQEKSTIYE